MTYLEIIERRRELRIDGHKTLADAGFDGEWVTPYQIRSRSPNGPVLIAYNWFDFPSAVQNREDLLEKGYMEGIPFNKVMDSALRMAEMDRSSIYMTQAFHLLPATRSQSISSRHIDISFSAVTCYELNGRRVIAIGSAASRACKRHGIEFIGVKHLSARGPGLTFEAKSRALANALKEATR